MTQSFLLRGARVLTDQGFLELEVLIKDGIVSEVSKKIRAANAKIIDLGNQHLIGSFVDLHCHVRQPGDEESEDITSLSLSAIKGGYSHLLIMPNTDPPIDRVEHVRSLRSEIKTKGLVNMLIAGSVSLERKGKRLSYLYDMALEGVRFFTDDGNGIENPELAFKAMKILKGFNAVFAEHLEDARLKGFGQVNEGLASASLGLTGIPPCAETIMLARDLILQRQTKVRYYAQHVSLDESLELLRYFKKDGDGIYAEVTPHHLFFTEEELCSFNTNFKINPPLRSKKDRDALRKALVADELDVIATDHAPHRKDLKLKPFTDTPFGTIGLETAFSGALSSLISSNWPLSRKEKILKIISEKMTNKPLEILGIDSHENVVREGNKANLVCLDVSSSRTYKEEEILSKSKNSCFIGREIQGQILHHFIGGKHLLKDGEVHI